MLSGNYPSDHLDGKRMGVQSLNLPCLLETMGMIVAEDNSYPHPLYQGNIINGGVLKLMRYQLLSFFA
jgi:hypothetical protein